MNGQAVTQKKLNKFKKKTNLDVLNVLQTSESFWLTDLKSIIKSMK